MGDDPTRRLGLDSIANPRALLEGLFEHAPVAFQVFTIEGHSVFVNQTFRDLFGAEPPPEYNVLKDDILESQGFLALVRRAFAGETIVVPPHWYDARDLRQVDVSAGRRVGITVTLFPLRGAAGNVEHIALCTKDVTAELELRTTTDALRRSEEQLLQAQKMEAVGRLAGGIAHDFNNLLSVILSYSDLLLGDLGPGAETAAELGEIKKAGLRAADLTRQMLAFSRQQVLAPRLLDLNGVVAGLEKMLTRVLGEDIELRTVLAPDLGKVMADPGQIEQVLMNMVVNARDAMPTGGRLTIETSNAVLDEPYAREHVGATPGPHVAIAVSDTGTGMDQATQERVFEPFFTTKERGKGTGLGLSTAFGIVRQSGGNISLHSELGHGTRFRVYLPRVEGDAALTGKSSMPPAHSRGSETILLVEDEDQVRAVASGILKRAGYRVLEASHPDAAIALCEQHPFEIHMLLTDVVMPKMSGRQLAERVASLRPETKVLFMSGYTDDAVLHHGVLSSGVAFLQKPLTPTSVTRKVREVLDAT